MAKPMQWLKQLITECLGIVTDINVIPAICCAGVDSDTAENMVWNYFLSGNFLFVCLFYGLRDSLEHIKRFN